MGSWSVLFSFFYVLSIWGVMSWISVYAIYLDLGVYVTKCNMGIGFLWKFSCFGFMWSKEIEKRRKANGLKREIREIWPLRNLKPLFVDEGKNLGGHRFKPVGNSKSDSTSQYMCSLLWLLCALIFCHNIVHFNQFSKLLPPPMINVATTSFILCLQVDKMEHLNVIIPTPPNLNFSPSNIGFNRVWNLKKTILICFKIG